jgi:septal ring factor EnvC (AmiA/AmiB activator)
MKTNFSQIIQNIVKNLSLAGLSLSIFNTVSNQTTIKSLRESLELEKDKNSKLITEVNNLIDKNNSQIESILSTNIEVTTNQNRKIEDLNNKINNLIDNKIFDSKSISDINN